ncbi:MAG TPA: glycosyltransferase family 2 protein, partial [Fimbriimonas sp.]|nr:glycosyltransferase family 2 protein [Fimbriimonas sp.]
NLGFGRANNLGMASATGDLVLFLNSDCYAHEGAIERLTEVFKEPAIVAAGGKLLNPDGSLQQSAANRLMIHNVVCEQLFLEPFAQSFGHWQYWVTKWLYPDEPSQVAQVMGACLMMRKSTNERFDEDYFLYCEDTDLCARLWRHGKIVYVPDAVFTHELGSSSTDSRWKSVCRYNAGKELYFAKFWGPGHARYVRFLHKVGAVLRLTYGFLGYPFLGSAREKFHTFKRVLTAKTEDFIPAEHRRR